MEKDLGLLLLAPTDVKLSEITIIQPDIFFIRKKREHIIKRNFVESSPDLTVEILSPTQEKLDRFTKMKHYAISGIEEYWLNVFERTGVFSEDFSPVLFPGLTIRLRQIFKGPGF